MVKKTKAQHQAEYLEYANNLLPHAVALDNDPDDDSDIQDDDEWMIIPVKIC